MAKKNSSKTATKEAMQAAEPQILTYTKWAGINIDDAPEGWEPESTTGYDDVERQTDLQLNYNVIQNNINLTATGTLETRRVVEDNEVTDYYFSAPIGVEFTGVTYLRDSKFYAAFNDNSIRYLDLESYDLDGNAEWHNVNIEHNHVEDEDTLVTYDEEPPSWDSTYTTGLKMQYNQVQNEPYVLTNFTPRNADNLYTTDLGNVLHSAWGQLGSDSSYVRGMYRMLGSLDAHDYAVLYSVDKPAHWDISRMTDQRITVTTYEDYPEVIIRIKNARTDDVIFQLSCKPNGTPGGNGWWTFEPFGNLRNMQWRFTKNLLPELDMTTSCRFEILMPRQRSYVWEMVQYSSHRVYKYSDWYNKITTGVGTVSKFYEDDPVITANYPVWELRYDDVKNNTDILWPYFSWLYKYVDGYGFKNISEYPEDEPGPDWEDGYLFLNYVDDSQISELTHMGIYDAGVITELLTEPRFVPGIFGVILPERQAAYLPPNLRWTQLYSYILDGVEQLLAFANPVIGSRDELIAYEQMNSELYAGPLRADPVVIANEVALPDPNLPNEADKPSGTYHGEIQPAPKDDYVTAVSVYYVLCNRYGQTKFNAHPWQAYLNHDPLLFTRSNYLSFTTPTRARLGIPDGAGDIMVQWYVLTNEHTNPIWVGRTELGQTFNWYGSMGDVNEWALANMAPDRNSNSTLGPKGSYMQQVDGRMYFWGGVEMPYRLTIGGSSRMELSCDRGNGGGYVDAEPGYGTIIKAVHKFKTASGASIVTVLCDNENTNLRKRFNLIESQITVDTAQVQQSWMLEEIANVIGGESRYGSGVWKDGMYVLGRYGLTVTTSAMEYNSQLESQVVSQVISPVFEEGTSRLYRDARMVYINGIIYWMIADPIYTERDDHLGRILDRVVMCYDVELKGYYTYTVGQEGDQPLHLMNIDYPGLPEGLGIVCRDKVLFVPTTNGGHEPSRVPPHYKLETGEISGSLPATFTVYVAQLELRFDYFCGSGDVCVVGRDYYGRAVEVRRHIEHAEQVNDLVEYIRIDQRLENYHVTFEGDAHFRLTHVNAKIYRERNRIGIVYGYDTYHAYRDANGKTGTMWADGSQAHTQIRSYNDLRRAIVP